MEKSLRKYIALITLAMYSQMSLAQAYDDIPEKFFALVAVGKNAEAVDFLYGTNPWLMRNADQAENLKAEFRKLDALVGKYSYHELVVEEKAGERYAHLIYVVGYERQPLRFELQLYRPAATWMSYGVAFDARLTDIVDKAANQRVSQPKARP